MVEYWAVLMVVRKAGQKAALTAAWTAAWKAVKKAVRLVGMLAATSVVH